MNLPAPIRNLIDRITGWFNSKELAKRFAGAVFWSFAGAVSQKLLLLATSFLCMRIMGKEDCGKLSIVRNTIQIFILFGAVGMGSTATKFIAEFRDTRREKLTGIYSIVNLLSISFGLLTTVVVLCFAGMIADYLKDPGLVHCIRIGALYLFFSIVNSIQTGILAGLEKFMEIAIVTAVSGVVEFVCIVLGAKYFGVMGALLGYGAGFMCMTLMNQIAIWWSRCPELRFSCGSIRLNEVRSMLAFSLPLVGSSLIVSPVMWYPQTLLVRDSGFSAQGIYDAANQWRMVFLFIPSALSRIVLPLLSNLNGKNNSGSYTRILKINLLVNGGTTFIFLVLFAAAAPLVLRGYDLPLSCYPTFVLLAASTVFSSLAAVFGQAIISKSRTWIGFLFNLCWGAMLISFSVLFLKMGMKETALSLGMLLAYFFHTLFQGVYFYFAFLRERGPRAETWNGNQSR